MSSNWDILTKSRQIYGLPAQLHLRSGLSNQRRQTGLTWAKSPVSQPRNPKEKSLSLSFYSTPDSDIDWNAGETSITKDYKNLRLTVRNCDSNDNSFDSSYTNVLPYYSVCRTRYKRNFNKYNKQFLNEIEKSIENQERAYEAAIYARIMSYTTLWPTYHSRLEIDRLKGKSLSDNLTRKQRLRLQYLLEHKIQ